MHVCLQILLFVHLLYLLAAACADFRDPKPTDGIGFWMIQGHLGGESTTLVPTLVLEGTILHY